MHIDSYSISTSCSWNFSLHIRRHNYWLILVFEDVVGQLPLYIICLLTFNREEYNLRSCRYIQLHVPLIKTEFGKTAFTYSAPVDWNQTSKHFKLSAPVFNCF